MRGVTDLSETMVKTIQDLEQIKKAYLDETVRSRYQILVCSGAGCVSSNCVEVRDAVRNELGRMGMSEQVIVRETGCIGTCAVGPVIQPYPAGESVPGGLRPHLHASMRGEVSQTHAGRGGLHLRDQALCCRLRLQARGAVQR